MFSTLPAPPGQSSGPQGTEPTEGRTAAGWWTSSLPEARIAFCTWERFLPIDGITELVSGAGRFSHYEVDFGDPRLAFANDTDFGAVRLELDPTVARYSFIDVGGQVLDSGQVRCRRPEKPGQAP